MNGLAKYLSVTLAVVGLTRPSAAWAQGGFSEEAAAEAAFRQAAKALEEGNLAEACERFEASQELDPALGTTLRLADCYDRLGKTASAWAAFQQAAAMARQQGQSEREEIALERAGDLYERLSYLALSITPETRELDGVEILLDDTRVPEGTWGTPIPIDPGVHVLTVQAPGYEEWSTELDVPETPGEEEATIPPLTEAVAVDTDGAEEQGVREVSYEPTAPDLSRDEEGSSTQTLAYTSGALGVAALGVASYFGYRAYSLHQQSLEHCLAGAGNSCSTRGKEIRDEAIQQGNYATVASAAGLALTGAAIVLFLTEPAERGVADSRGLTVVAGASPAGAGVEIGGTW